jgi:riboflavin synthase
MMMCDLLIVIDPGHPDRNSLDELAAALECMGATVVEIDTSRHVIEAVVAAPHVETLHHLGGVSYVRPVFSYHRPPTRAA